MVSLTLHVFPTQRMHVNQILIYLDQLQWRFSLPFFRLTIKDPASLVADVQSWNLDNVRGSVPSKT